MDYVPNEVWLKILKHLQTYDIIQFCSVFPKYSYFLKDKNIVSTFDVGGKFEMYDFNLHKYILREVDFSLIKSLNVNQMYWIPLDELRKIIKGLPNLEELRALDTKLGLRERDLKVYSKLKKLAITIEDAACAQSKELYSNSLYLLKSFCVKILSNRFNNLLSNLFEALVGLEELWICHADDGYPIKYDYIVYNLKFLKKLVIKSKLTIPFLDYKPFGLAKVFEIRRLQSIVIYYVNCPIPNIIPIKDLSIFDLYETPLEEAFDVFQKLHCEMPWGPYTAEDMYMNRSIKKVKFKELNFGHHKFFCQKKYINAAIAILKSENARELKKLSIKSCLLQAKHDYYRKSKIIDVKDYPIQDVISNCPEVEELEVYNCLTCNITILDGYPLILGFKKLTKLTLEIPVHLDGKFLTSMFPELKIEFLNIISSGTNEKLNANLYAALPNASSLKHFRLQTPHIHYDKLFYSLNQITNCRLQRIVLLCDSIDWFSNTQPKFKNLIEFIEKNPQLIFLYTCITYIRTRQSQEIKDIYLRYKKNHTARIYLANKDQVPRFYCSYPVPDVHKEFLNYDTDIATIRFEDY